MITLENVSKSYQTERVETRAVSNVSLQIDTGEFLAITGRSGSGKSTLASMIGLLEQPTGGRLVFAGQDTTRCSPARLTALRRDHVGFVFQSFHLIAHLNVWKNVELALAGLGLSATARRRRSLEMLEKLGVASRADHFPRQLSGGQQQRVALARALVRKPDLLVCDEPTGNLDSGNSENVVSLLRDAHAEGATVLVVTHDDRVAEVASRRLTMSDGVVK